MSPDEHLARPWRVHALAEGFELLDVWDFGIVSPERDGLDRFVGVLQEVMSRLTTGRGPTGLLFRLRGAMGRVFHWDDEARRVAVPREESLRARLGDTEREQQPWAHGDDGEIRPVDFGGFQLVFRRGDEALYELSNATVHALLHLGWVDAGEGYSPRMAVYAKKKGLLGKGYMALIAPFRHAIVYPTLLREVRRAWRDRGDG